MTEYSSVIYRFYFIMKFPILLAGALAVTSLSAASDWVPNHKDKPVAAPLLEAINQALPTEAIVAPQAQRRVLVYSATAGYRHGSIPTGKVALEEMGKSTGAYETIISDDPANFEKKALKEFDAVVLLSPTLDFFMPHKKQKKRFSEEEWKWLQARHDRLIDNLVEYVEDGGGLMGIHSATDSCYKHSEYPEVIGGLFDGHPWGAKNNVTIVVEDPEHATMAPVFGDIKDFRIKEEIYQFQSDPYSREKLRVLLHLDPERSDSVKKMKREDNDYAVAWVQAVGKGRVFYTSIGHNHDIFSNPLMLKHYLAGIQFATGDLKADTTPSAQIDIPNMKR